MRPFDDKLGARLPRVFALVLVLFWTVSWAVLALSAQGLASDTGGGVLNGEVLKACVVAYQDFTKLLAKEHAGGKGKPAEPLSRVEDYDVKIEERPDEFLIMFLPALPKFIDVKGGGAGYTIRRNDFKITDRILYK